MPPEVAPAAVVVPPQKIGKFKASRIIVSESWSVLKQDKELLFFPVVSAIVSLIATGVFIIGYILFAPAIPEGFSRENMTGLEYLVVLVYYILVFFVANFFQTAMYVIINGRFSGLNLGFMDGVKGALANIGNVFMWSLISATVGVVLRTIADNFKLAGQIVAGLLGAAWSIMTYFSLLSLVIGKTTVKGSFKESAAIIRKTWGEVLIVNTGVGLFFGIITFGVLFALLVLGMIVQNSIVFIALGVIFVLFLIAVIVVSSTLDAIFKFALYEYGRSGKIISGFTQEIITGAFKKK
ncbi:MAG: hypothetical protein RLZZ67_324 [Candidatus Parcubacteria bacterium]|jgi:hypothetical protein